MKLVNHNGYWTPQGNEKVWARYENRAKDMQVAVDQCRHLRTVVQASGVVGAWPIWLSHQFTEVITVEPDRANYVCLERNCEQYKNIESHNATLGAEVNAATERVLTIDGFNLEYCDLIVLDNDGREAAVLQGAQDTIARCKPVIFIRGSEVELSEYSVYQRVGRGCVLKPWPL